MGRREALLPAGPLGEFAKALRDLRAGAPGAPTYRELAERARYSRTALSDAASGRRLPSWDVTAAFVTACGADPQEWRPRWEQLDTELRVGAATSPAPQESATAPAASPVSSPDNTSRTSPILVRDNQQATAKDAHRTDDGPGPQPEGPQQAPVPPRPDPGPSQPAARRFPKRAAVIGALAVAAVLAVTVSLIPDGHARHTTLGAATRPSSTASPSPGRPSPTTTASGAAHTPTPTRTATTGPTNPALGLTDPAGNGQPNPGKTTAGAAHAPTGAATPPAQATVWTGYAGARCASTGAAPTSFYDADGSWHTTTGGAYSYGCKAAQYVHLTGSTRWTANADWVFHPPAAASGCTFTIHIAAGTWTHTAQYEVYDTDSTNNGAAEPISSFTFNQGDYDNGGWYTTSRYPATTGTIDLALTNAGTDRHGVVADLVKTTCT